MADANGASKPDFTAGFRFQDLRDGVPIAGRVGDDDVILVRRGDEVFAVGASCTHYHGPLADGLVVGDTVRCPWHHACFSLRTGEALRAPALDPDGCPATDTTTTPAALHVFMPGASMLAESIDCVPGTDNDGRLHWYYRWSWGELLHDVSEPAAAAAKIADVLSAR